MIAGQLSDCTGAAALLDDMPNAQWLLGDRGYDASWFRDALQAKGIQPCIPVRYGKRRYRRRSRMEIMFGRLKDRRRVATPMIEAQQPSSPPSPPLLPSSFGCDQRVLTLDLAFAVAVTLLRGVGSRCHPFRYSCNTKIAPCSRERLQSADGCRCRDPNSPNKPPGLRRQTGAAWMADHCPLRWPLIWLLNRRTCIVPCMPKFTSQSPA
jgi:transposase